jgi:hypothetical protein
MISHLNLLTIIKVLIQPLKTYLDLSRYGFNMKFSLQPRPTRYGFNMKSSLQLAQVFTPGFSNFYIVTFLLDFNEFTLMIHNNDIYIRLKKFKIYIIMNQSKELTN